MYNMHLLKKKPKVPYTVFYQPKAPWLCSLGSCCHLGRARGIFRNLQEQKPQQREAGSCREAGGFLAAAYPLA